MSPNLMANWLATTIMFSRQLLGFRFAPRIRCLGNKHLYIPDHDGPHPALAPLIGGKLNLALIQGQWAKVVRLAISIRHETVNASLMMRNISNHPRR